VGKGGLVDGSPLRGPAPLACQWKTCAPTIRAVLAPGRDPGSALIGRHRECEALEQLVAGIRARRSSVLVLHGESGVGKMLEHALGVASDCRVMRAAGVASEREIAFAGLHQLCAPMLERLEDLPGHSGTHCALLSGCATVPRRTGFWWAWPS
jgi:hypothetical protein